jgi:hypothetical protein
MKKYNRIQEDKNSQKKALTEHPSGFSAKASPT